MKLYKEFRKGELQRKKEDADRAETQLDEQVVIIYEESNVMTLLKGSFKKIIAVLTFLGLIAGLGIGAMFLLLWLQGR